MDFGNVSTNFFSLTGWDTRSVEWCCLESQPADGVTCTSGRVTGLSLSNSGIRGSFMPSFSDLNALRTLELDQNQFSGTLDSLAGFLTFNLVPLRQQLGRNTGRLVFDESNDSAVALQQQLGWNS